MLTDTDFWNVEDTLQAIYENAEPDADIFINCTQHKLTKSQQNAIQTLKRGKDIVVVDFESIAPSLFNSLKNSPDNYRELSDLAFDFVQSIGEIYFNSPEGVKVYVHLPIGSPALQYFISIEFSKLKKIVSDGIELVFSHSERKSVSQELPNGEVVKKSVFEFKKFILI